MVSRQKGNTREAELIEATLACIAREGMRKVTVRKIAEYAGVTNGLIRFYFSNKAEIIRAAYAKLLEETFFHTSSAIDDMDDVPAAERLRAYIVANMSPPVVSRDSLLLWANFLPLTHDDPEMANIRRHGYLETTGRFVPLIADAIRADGREITDAETRRRAIKINALVDGLWLEGCLSPEDLKPAELQKIALSGASSLLGVDLT